MARPTLTLYTKPGCHLCEAVEQAIAQVARRRPLEVVLRNILDDPADLERYQYEIPVVLLDGVEIARYRLTAEELEAAVARLTGRTGGNG
jgi:glutaredoxin